MIKIALILSLKRHREFPPFVWVVTKEFASVYKFKNVFYDSDHGWNRSFQA